jgi:hypothetical protein
VRARIPGDAIRQLALELIAWRVAAAAPVLVVLDVALRDSPGPVAPLQRAAGAALAISVLWSVAGHATAASNQLRREGHSNVD